MEDLVNVRHGSYGGDQTCPYYMEIKKEFTVKDFVNAVISNESEWGYIGINDRESIFGNPKIKYSHGTIITNNFDEDILNKIVTNISGSGGWTRSDYLLTI